MDYEIDLDNILSSSQEAAMEILHENNNNKMTDEEKMVMVIVLRWSLLREFAYHIRNDYRYYELCREN